MTKPLISLRGVNLEYSTEVESISALNDVSLDIFEGDLFAIMGASGSGKTSLINVIAGLLSADRGEVLIGEHNLMLMSSSQRAKVRLEDIGVIFQDHNLIPEFNVLDNVSLPLRAQGVSKDKAYAESEKKLSLVGLSGSGSRYPRQLSGGQQQRVGIARALMGEKKILLTDEPTGSLDATNSDSVFALLEELAKSGVCVVVASHDPKVLKVATRLALVSDGVLEEQPGIAT